MSDPGKAVFLSYASQDAEAAKRICDALRQAGVEVWFDQSELVGGDAWDQKIRKQIGSCALFIPIVSASTQARAEGYFRLEWKLADRRTDLIGKSKAFLLPVCIDDTRDSEADVPDSFLAVQWTRLKDGETPLAFVARVKKLLGGENAEDRGQRTEVRAHGTSQVVPAARPRWLAPVVLAAGLAAAAVSLWQPWKPDHRATDDAAKPAARAEAARPATPADKLVERANDILNGSALSREQIDAANGLLEQAMVLEPTNAVAWTAAARADLTMIHPYRFDRSAERRQRAMSRATRALNLAPDSFATRVVHTAVLAHASDNPALTKEAEETFRRMIREQPDDKSLQVQLGEVLREQERFEEAAALFEQIGVFELAGWSWFQAGRFADAYAPVKRAVVEHRTITALSLKALIEFNWFQDLGLAQATLDQLRPSELQGGSGIVTVTDVAFSRRDPERMLQLLNALPRDYIETPGFVGPRQYLTGWAHRIAGRTERAKIEWRKALAVLQTELTSAPDRVQLIVLESEIHALLGETAEAERLLTKAQRIANEAPGTVGKGNIRVYLALGRNEPALSWLGSYLRARSDHSWPGFHAEARFSPIWDGLRGDPRFEALLRETKPADAVPFDSPPAAVGLVAPDSKSVAVLAFANLSDDKGNEYFSDGISEELLNVLAKIPGLKVTARTSSFHFKGKDTPIPEIAQQLGVAYVIEGSVRKQGDKVRITAQLIKAADGFHVWSDTFTRDLKDIFAVQDEIAGLIAQQLQLKLGESTRVTKVVNPEAYRLVLEGRQFWNLRSEEGFTKAEAAFTKALALDPQFAEAHAGLGGVCVIRAVYRELDDVPLEANDLVRAVSEGRRALEIDPSSAEAHAVLGYAQMMGNQLAEADRHFQQALELSPNSALVHCWYALVLGTQGRLDVSLLHYQKAAEVDPLWFINLQMLGGSLAFAQRFDQSLGIIDRAAALRTEIFLPNSAERARALLALGRKEEAFGAARDILRHPDDRPRWHSDAIAIRVLWEGGRRQEAEDEAARLFARWPQDSYLRGFTLVALGRFDEALAFLKYTPSSVVRSIYWDALWDPWREDPRFTQLIAKLGRAEEYKVARATLARMQQDAARKK